ncbi:Uncharacterised protein [Vibrio cholerae]|uniref:Uncharacterized protein n=1 Tax=Vibrio cholerae TaxID=666 RepID=A0A655PXB9_VIBCL|nr:Uncharacterised protein [Vibrio cholerae]CSB69757.1 Uncharacterised protein [Vibrio cholerae]
MFCKRFSVLLSSMVAKCALPALERQCANSMRSMLDSQSDGVSDDEYCALASVIIAFCTLPCCR